MIERWVCSCRMQVLLTSFLFLSTRFRNHDGRANLIDAVRLPLQQLDVNKRHFLEPELSRFLPAWHWMSLLLPRPGWRTGEDCLLLLWHRRNGPVSFLSCSSTSSSSSCSSSSLLFPFWRHFSLCDVLSIDSSSSSSCVHSQSLPRSFYFLIPSVRFTCCRLLDWFNSFDSTARWNRPSDLINSFDRKPNDSRRYGMVLYPTLPCLTTLCSAVQYSRAPWKSTSFSPIEGTTSTSNRSQSSLQSNLFTLLSVKRAISTRLIIIR